MSNQRMSGDQATAARIVRGRISTFRRPGKVDMRPLSDCDCGGGGGCSGGDCGACACTCACACACDYCACACACACDCGACGGSGQSTPLQTLRRLREDAGAATAEYVVATMAAVGFAGLLIVILRGDAVRSMLTDLVRSALTVG